MALTYEKVIAVISRPPDLRKDFEVNNLLPWFRKKSELFRTLKTDLLFDIIKNLQYITKNKDELIIKQGDIGDCMYILLRGKVTIYIQYNKTDDDGDKPTPAVISNKEQSIRQQLGTFVCPLGPGATFGEVALMSDDCIRTASIISDETSDLIVVDRELYNRSVKNVLKQEFEDKTNFIANNPFFQTWAPKYKKQLAMALIKDSFPYEGMIAKQGEEVESIYFILQGEVKVVVDPAQHKTQYHKLLGPKEDDLPIHEHKDEEEEDLVNRSMNGSMSGRDSRQEAGLPSKFRRKVVKKQPQEVCLLGVNESVGDIEVLLEMDTYMQTAICTQKTEVLILEMKHYERLLVKRNPRTIENMKEGLELRIKSRVSRHVEKNCPIFKTLQQKAEDYNEQKKLQNEARMLAHEKPQKHNKTMQEVFDSFVPPRGPLIDLYGPGTVFHHIRERDKAKRVRQQKRKGFGFNGMGPGGGGLAPANAQSNQSPFNGGFRMHSANSVDPATSDPVLSQLENRMRQWLQNDTSGQRGPVRVAPLHRSTTETEHLKPGAKVVLRPKASGDGERSGSRPEDDDMMLHTGHAWARTKLEHYNNY